MRSPYIQSSAADISSGKNVRKRFDELTAALAEIGASYRVALQTHDDVRIEIDCPKGREVEAQTILDRIFPP